MIKTLTLVSLLSCGVGSQATPHFNNEQINETKHVEQRRLYENNTSGSQQDADLTWELNSGTLENKQHITWDGTIASDNTKKLSYVNQKWGSYTESNVGNMYTNTYLNKTLERIEIDNTNYTGWYMPLQTIYLSDTDYDYTHYDHINTQLYQIQFTPYNAIKTSTIDLAFNIDVSTWITFGEYFGEYPPGLVYPGIRYKVKYLISTTANWGQYFDATMTQDYVSNWNTIEQMTNSQNGYSYTSIDKIVDIYASESWYTEHIQQGMSAQSTAIDQRITITQTIPIANERTTYIAIYLEPLSFLGKTRDNLDPTAYYVMTEQQIAEECQFFETEIGGYSLPNLKMSKIVDKKNNYISTASNLNTTDVQWQWSLIHNSNVRTYGTWLPTPTTEIIDLPGVMFNVLGMPWTFISTAFNLTLFPGTPYSVNIGSILLMVLGVLIFVFLIRLIVFRK